MRTNLVFKYVELRFMDYELKMLKEIKIRIKSLIFNRLDEGLMRGLMKDSWRR